jgi:hypothetical protein
LAWSFVLYCFLGFFLFLFKLNVQLPDVTNHTGGSAISMSHIPRQRHMFPVPHQQMSKFKQLYLSYLSINITLRNRDHSWKLTTYIQSYFALGSLN